MKLYLISQSETKGYDTFSDMVVCADSEEDAKSIHPRGDWGGEFWQDHTWCSAPEAAKAQYLGEAVPDLTRGVVCSSFHAG